MVNPAVPCGEGGIRDSLGTPRWQDGDLHAVTTLTCGLEELCWSHPLGEANLCQAVTRQLWLWGVLAGPWRRLARPIGGLVAHQPLGPVGHWLEALQLPLPV